MRLRERSLGNSLADAWLMLKLLALLALVGCGTTVRTIMINQPPRPMTPRPALEVQLLTSGPPQRPYVDVAYLEAEQDSEWSADATPEFFTKVRERAANLGCDAVVIGNPTHRNAGAMPFNKDGRNLVNGVTATCIMYLDEPIATSNDSTATITKP